MLFHTDSSSSSSHTEREREREMGMTVGMVLLLCSMNVFIKAVGLANSSCRGVAVCGIVTIPYPFGIEPGCYVDDWFAIDCKNTTLGSP